PLARQRTRDDAAHRAAGARSMDPGPVPRTPARRVASDVARGVRAGPRSLDGPPRGAPRAGAVLGPDPTHVGRPDEPELSPRWRRPQRPAGQLRGDVPAEDRAFTGAGRQRVPTRVPNG